MASPVYAFAVWRYANAYLDKASSDEKGWMIVLFPLLSIPPLISWMKIAAPISLALASRNAAVKVIILLIALFSAIEMDVTSFALFDVPDPQIQAVSFIGDLTPSFFKIGIWALVGIGALLSYTIHKRPGRSAVTNG